MIHRDKTDKALLKRMNALVRRGQRLMNRIYDLEYEWDELRDEYNCVERMAKRGKDANGRNQRIEHEWGDEMS